MSESNSVDRLKVLIIDDHQLFADGIACLLKHSFSSINIMHSKTLIESARLLNFSDVYDIILLDIDQPKTIDFQTIIEIKNTAQASKIILISDVENKELIIHTISSGLDGYIPKSIPGPLFIGAINLVLSGGVYIPKIAVTGQAKHIQTCTTKNTNSRQSTNAELRNNSIFTKRQLDLLKLLENGLSNKEIARKLNISDGTVRIHMSTMYRILDVQNRTQAVIKSKELGYI